ncbi:hypothetical protein [Micromonospora aurantiaca (nom. illeg.)]|uniref:hypothetical protein n=1 Tax=Micromonospora aurantiaca (nom. illeg.) TaxID=47850 RepID=UPI0033EDBF21
MDLVRLRHVGPTRVRVPKLGRVVEPDELVGVPRDVFERYAWPESLWRRDGDEEQSTTTTTSKRGSRDA